MDQEKDVRKMLLKTWDYSKIKCCSNGKWSLFYSPAKNEPMNVEIPSISIDCPIPSMHSRKPRTKPLKLRGGQTDNESSIDWYYLYQKQKEQEAKNQSLFVESVPRQTKLSSAKAHTSNAILKPTVQKMAASSVVSPIKYGKKANMSNTL